MAGVYITLKQQKIEDTDILQDITQEASKLSKDPVVSVKPIDIVAGATFKTYLLEIKELQGTTARMEVLFDRLLQNTLAESSKPYHQEILGFDPAFVQS